MTELLVLFAVIGFIVGVCFGKFITDYNWFCNATEPKRILYNKQFYKVVKINNKNSWKFACTHNPWKNN